MTRIHELKIKNFRGIRDFSNTFGAANFICLIGRGDSGKSTILDAISYVLSSSWNLTFFDRGRIRGRSSVYKFRRIRGRSSVYKFISPGRKPTGTVIEK